MKCVCIQIYIQAGIINALPHVEESLRKLHVYTYVYIDIYILNVQVYIMYRRALSMRCRTSRRLWASCVYTNICIYIHIYIYTYIYIHIICVYLYLYVGGHYQCAAASGGESEQTTESRDSCGWEGYYWLSAHCRQHPVHAGICIHVYMYMHRYTIYIYVYIHIYIYIYTCVYIYMCIYTNIYRYVNICIFTMYMSIYTCMYTGVYICIYICMYWCI